MTSQSREEGKQASVIKDGWVTCDVERHIYRQGRTRASMHAGRAAWDSCNESLHTSFALNLV